MAWIVQQIIKHVGGGDDSTEDVNVHALLRTVTTPSRAQGLVRPTRSVETLMVVEHRMAGRGRETGDVKHRASAEDMIAIFLQGVGVVRSRFHRGVNLVMLSGSFLHPRLTDVV